MTIEEILDAAASGTRLKKIGNYDWWQELLWFQMRDAQQLKANGKLTTEQYEERRRVCIQAARKNGTHEYIRKKLVEEQAELWEIMETVGTEYAKNRTLENADRLYEALYHVPIHGREDNAV